MKLRRRHKEQTEFVSPKQEVREEKKFNLRDLLGGDVLSREIVIRQIPFALFLFAMLLFYIANQYRGDKVMKDIVDVEQRLKELRTVSVSNAFELMEKSKQSEVKRRVKDFGLNLEEAQHPPITLEAD